MAKIPTFSATSTGPRFPEPKARFPKVPRRRGRGPGQAVGLRGAIEEGRVSVTSIPRDHGSRTRPALSRACAPADPGPHPFAAGRVGADALRLFRSFRRRRRCNPQICANLEARRVQPAGGGHLQVSVPSTPASSACPSARAPLRICAEHERGLIASLLEPTIRPYRFKRPERAFKNQTVRDSLAASWP